MRPAPLRTMSISTFDFAACTMVDYPAGPVMRRTSPLSLSASITGAPLTLLPEARRHRPAPEAADSCAPGAFYTADGAAIVKSP